MEYEVHEDRLDMGKLTQSLTMKLNEAMNSVNPKVNTQEEEKDQEYREALYREHPYHTAEEVVGPCATCVCSRRCPAPVRRGHSDS